MTFGRIPLLARTIAAAVVCSCGAGVARAGKSTCIPVEEAHQQIGANRCVRGRVVRVEKGDHGEHYLDFCEDYRTCPFSVVVFARDLKQVGDVRGLAGKDVEIRGEVREYDGRAEIVLERASQLQGEAARIPPVPKNYDVEQRGHYSAGKFSHAKKPSNTTKKKSKPPASIDWDTESGQDD
jgi:hypothetical protein